jgi:hypothetical protein
MTQINNENNSIKAFSSTDEDKLCNEYIEHKVSGVLDRGGKFWGTLEAFNAESLFIRGDRGQKIIIKRRRIAELEVI